uniref:Uncharacterized protein n=1 Tax=Magallana gigas TaxID=29159 RepID=K1R1M0_MAGGI
MWQDFKFVKKAGVLIVIKLRRLLQEKQLQAVLLYMMITRLKLRGDIISGKERGRTRMI